MSETLLKYFGIDYSNQLNSSEQNITNNINLLNSKESSTMTFSYINFCNYNSKKLSINKIVSSDKKILNSPLNHSSNSNKTSNSSILLKSANKNKISKESILLPPEQSEFPKLLYQAKNSKNIFSKCFALLEIKKLLLSLNNKSENNIDINPIDRKINKI